MDHQHKSFARALGRVTVDGVIPMTVGRIEFASYATPEQRAACTVGLAQRVRDDWDARCQQAQRFGRDPGAPPKNEDR